MEVKNTKRWVPRGPNVWLVAVAALALAALIRLMLHPLLGPVMPAGVFFIATALVEYYCGLGPAMMVMVLGLGLADYMFVPPYFQIEVITRRDIVLAIVYPLMTILVIVLLERLRRAQYRAELMALVAQSRYEMILRHDNEQAIVRRTLDETHRLVLHLAQYNKNLILIQALEREAGRGHGGIIAGMRLPVPNEIAPGPRFGELDPEELKRFRNGGLTPGHVWVLLKHNDAPPQRTECLCERFTTHAGDFLVLRLGD
jgi:hypothetical protein